MIAERPVDLRASLIAPSITSAPELAKKTTLSGSGQMAATRSAASVMTTLWLTTLVCQ